MCFLPPPLLLGKKCSEVLALSPPLSGSERWAEHKSCFFPRWWEMFAGGAMPGGNGGFNIEAIHQERCDSSSGDRSAWESAVCQTLAE